MAFLGIALLITFDQLTKIIATRLFTAGEVSSIAFGFYFTYAENTGAGFSLFQGNAFTLGLISAFFSGALASFYVLNLRTLSKTSFLAVSLILSGALGNMLDRLWFGYVRDFLGIPGVLIINMADLYVIAGAILLLIHLSRLEQLAKKDTIDLDEST